MKVKIKKLEGFKIPSNSSVKLVICGNILKVVYSNIISNNLENYKKISKNEVLNIKTGEIIKCEKSETRKDNIVSLKRTITKLRDLINCNFLGDNNELFITLTYKENMTDHKKLYKDFDVFYKKLKYRFKDTEFCYISAVEPQKRGAWHVHLLLKALNKDYLYIDNSIIAELWRHGFTKTNRIDEVDNVGAYLCSYLTDLLGDGGDKKKGARLHLYPAGINIYRCSKNCKRPEEERVAYKELTCFNDFKTYEVSYEVYSEVDEGKKKLFNIVKKEFYNLRRKKC